MSAPRYFVQHPGSADDETTCVAAGEVEQILGVVSLHSRLFGANEYIIGRDALGNVNLFAHEERALFGRRAQAALTYHDVATQARLPRLDVETFYVFCIELVEQAPDAPGLNDPLYVYGDLVGPFPRHPGSPPTRSRGQLTLTRRDLLAGFSLGRELAFRTEGVEGVAGESRCIGTVVGAEPPDVLRQGRGIVLAIPMFPADMSMTSSANEGLVAEIISDVLHAAQADAQANLPGHPFASKVLPVANRAAIESSLRNDGFTIEGDRAVRASTGKVAATFQKAFGLAETRELPREAKLDELLALSNELVKSIDQTPNATLSALSALACTHEGTPLVLMPGVMPDRATPIPRASQPRPVPGPTPKVQTPRDDWMKDFVAAHQKPGAPKPKLTSARALAPKKEQKKVAATNSPAPSGKPDWMKDFE